MSFVTAAPEQVQAAAQNLAGIRSTLAGADASVAAPTTGMVAAAEDEVSAGVAAFFGAFGQEYQVLSEQAQAFHEQFVNLLNSGAAAYLSTEVTNAEQSLLNGVNGLVHGLPGESAVFAGSILGGATSAGQNINGVVISLQNGGSLLSGQLGPGLQSLDGGVAGLPTALISLEHALAPGALQTGAAASTSLSTIEAPYQTLVVNTATNLQALGALWSANPAPFLHQFVNNQIGYAQTIGTGLQTLIQNVPAELANLPASIQAAIQALLASNPIPYLQQFISNQIAYAQIISTSLQNAANDFGTGLTALPAAFQSAIQALATGDIDGAANDIRGAFTDLFFTGFNITGVDTTTFAITPNGTLGDLLPILTIPGQMAQNFTNLLTPGTIPAQVSQNFTNVINTVTDTSITSSVDANLVLNPPSLNVTLTNTLGLPVALAIDAVGGPYNALSASGTSATAFVNAVQTGDGLGAAAAVLDAPAFVANGFLNGESTLPITFVISGFQTTLNLPLSGILVPPTAYTATIDAPPPFGTTTAPVGGTPLSGIIAGLYNASLELAEAIS